MSGDGSTAPPETLHLACATEGDYHKHAAAMLVSALDNAGERPLAVHYLHGPRFPRVVRAGISDLVAARGGSVRFHRIPGRAIRGVPTRGFTRKATWYRVLLPDLLPQLDRMLYLDSDALVLESLEELWQADLTGHAVAAVTNIFQPDWIGRTRQLGIPPRRYFNAGVLLMNLAEMRRMDATRRLLDYGAANARTLTLRDQDALNVILGERRLDLHPRWNCMNSILAFPAAKEVFGERAVAEARIAPAIRHFEGPGVNKPWDPGCEREQRELYADYRRRTPWPRIDREDEERGGRNARRLRP